ncbi:hypothetical protein BpHYR1_037199 [Brachionus plicatilis]|uniref:Uncharacterized protein n=1 Tax=Brachionus plicatilis TaxID=10195 RepID=A0A3M7SI46_BRAPC|nr:hypothetical protein BpHYR1_037199 [Brachionus plicatilis]
MVKCSALAFTTPLATTPTPTSDTNELGQVFNGVDVVVRRRTDQSDTRYRISAISNVLCNFVAGQFAAFARLGALSHLDLNVVRMRQINTAHPEAARGHLLNGRPCTNRTIGAILIQQTLCVLASLARVRLSLYFVHGPSQRLMRLDRNRAKAHGTSGEPLHYLCRRLHLVQRHSHRFGIVHLKLAPYCAVAVGFCVQLRKLFVSVVTVFLGGLLQRGNGARVVDVSLTRVAPVVGARVDGEPVVAAVARPIRQQVAVVGLGGQEAEVDAADARRRALEAPADHLAVYAHCFEYLRAFVRLQGGYAHFGHDLGDAVLGRCGVVGKYALVVELGVEQ